MKKLTVLCLLIGFAANMMAAFYTLSIYAQGCETPTQYLCDEGQQLSVTAVPQDGYHFTQWSDGNTDNPRTFTLTADIACTAQFESASANTYTLSIYAQGCETPTQYLCDEGQQLSVTAVPQEGYHFTQWSDGNTDNPRTIIVKSDMALTAEFIGEEVPTAIDEVKPTSDSSLKGRAKKVLRNGQVSILRGDQTYTVTGQEVK